MADPRRMTPEEHGEAHALLVRAVTEAVKAPIGTGRRSLPLGGNCGPGTGGGS
jgi:hypothetical protein